MSEQTIQHKQGYLRDKILEKGHDAEAFMAYCEQNYGEINLQGWSFAKLKEIVKGFLGQKAEKTFTQQQLDDQNDEKVIEEEFEEETIPPQLHVTHQPTPQKQLMFSEADWGIFGLGPSPPQKQINIAALQFSSAFNTQSMSPASGLPKKKQEAPSVISSPRHNPVDLDQSIFSAVIQQNKWKKSSESDFSKKSPTKQFQDLKVQQVNQSVPSSKIVEIGTVQMKVLASKHLSQLPFINDVKIIKTEQKTRNFLQGDYTLYHIQFSPCNHVIQRKFNDFRKLRTILQKIYPHVRLPYLEAEGWLVNSCQAKDPQTLTKYKHMVVEFLKYITIRNDLLKKSKIVRIFTGLIEGTPTDFKKYENIAKPKTFSELCLPGGKLYFQKYENILPIDKYMNNTQLLSGNIDLCYEKLRKSMETLFYNYEHVSKSLVEVAGIFETLESLIQKFNYDNDGNKDLRVYQGIKQVCLHMKESIDGQYGIFKNQLQALFKYERENMTTLKEINETRTKMFNQYCRQGLHSKKTSQYIPKGETMIEGNISIEQPSKTNKNQLTVQNLFWSCFTIKNAQEYWEELRFKINERLTLIAYEELDNENKTLNFWNNVIKKCVM